LSVGAGGSTLATLEAPKAGGHLKQTNFRTGDLISIESVDSDAADTKATRVDGVLIQITRKKIVVGLNAVRGIPYGWHGWCTLRRRSTDITYRRILEALNGLLLTEKRPTLHSVLFGDGVARIEEMQVRFINGMLNDSQKEAVRAALGAEPVALVHGPPGTGKTHTVVEIVRQFCLMNKRVLVCAPSNVAVDNLVERLGRTKSLEIVRLGHPARILPMAAAYSLDTQIRKLDPRSEINELHVQLDLATRDLSVASPGKRRKLERDIRRMRNKVRRRETKASKKVIGKSQVVLSTLSGAGSRFLADQEFDVAIIDEATQASEAECWIAALKAPKLILAGDHHQLPPMTKLRDVVVKTLFDRVRVQMPGTCRMLTTQYRMHRDIALASSCHLYDGRLVPDCAVAEHLLCDLGHVKKTENTRKPLVLIDTAGSNMFEQRRSKAKVIDAKSQCNHGEATQVHKHIKALVSSGVLPGQIAVISPYNAQVRLLRLMLEEKYPELEVGSVDGFQGQEKEAIILTLVRSNKTRSIGFLRDYRRINVAITRARRHLCVVADSSTVSRGSGFLRVLFDHLRDNADIRDVASKKKKNKKKKESQLDAVPTIS
ncbi:hypothetical protein LPJ75_003726, partial [Coemansia sp. RSA 2598]